MDSNSQTEATSRNSLQDKSNGSGLTLIQLEGVTKVFYTEEVETHALSGIHLQIKKGEYLSIRSLGLREIHPAFHLGAARFTH